MTDMDRLETTPAIELVHVSKHFEAFTAVHDTDLAIGEGEFFSLLGPSGCGKTTTLRMIAGFEQPTGGEIRLKGKDITAQPPHLRNVNMVFQNYALFPHMTIFDNVAFGLQVRRLPGEEIRERVLAALEMVQLTGMVTRKPAQLSGGQQQRVALARALVNRPAVLLLDEPLGALDQKLRKEMQLELKDLQREVGITFVYVTHDQEEALTMSDRIAVMSAGHVLQVDAPRAIYEHPATRFVADFIGVTNFLDGRLVSSDGREAVVEVDRVGALRAGPRPEMTAGQPVTVAVRPERMRLAAGGNEDNGVAGTLEEIVFVGNDTHYFVRLGGGPRVMVREQNQVPTDQGVPFEPGQSVTVAWAIASTTLLRE